MKNDILNVLFTKEEIEEKVSGLAEQITKDYDNKDLVLIGALKGCAPFMCDLMRKIPMKLEIDFVVASSYGTGTQSSGEVKIAKDITTNIEGRHVLIIEDIIDTGVTLKFLKEKFSKQNPASIKICTLFDKPEGRKAEISADYVGYKLPNKFVVGYGLDYAEKYRNLPYLAVLKPEVYTK